MRERTLPLLLAVGLVASLAGCWITEIKTVTFDVQGVWRIEYVEFVGSKARQTEIIWLVRNGDRLEGFNIYDGTVIGPKSVEIPAEGGGPPPEFRYEFAFQLRFDNQGNYVQFRGDSYNGGHVMGLNLTYVEYEDGIEVSSGSTVGLEQFPSGTMSAQGTCQGVVLDRSWRLPFGEQEYKPGLDLLLDWIRVSGMSEDDLLDVTFRDPPDPWESSRTYALGADLDVEVSYSRRDGGGFASFPATSGTLVTPRLIENEVYMMSGTLTVDCPDGGQLVVRLSNVYPI